MGLGSRDVSSVAQDHPTARIGPPPGGADRRAGRRSGGVLCDAGGSDQGADPVGAAIRNLRRSQPGGGGRVPTDGGQSASVELRLAGLVQGTRDGRQVFYQLRGGHVRNLLQEAMFHADHQLTGEPLHD